MRLILYLYKFNFTESIFNFVCKDLCFESLLYNPQCLVVEKNFLFNKPFPCKRTVLIYFLEKRHLACVSTAIWWDWFYKFNPGKLVCANLILHAEKEVFVLVMYKRWIRFKEEGTKLNKINIWNFRFSHAKKVLIYYFKEIIYYRKIFVLHAKIVFKCFLFDLFQWRVDF